VARRPLRHVRPLGRLFRLSGTWNGRKYGGYAEHIQRMAKIPIPVYLKEVAGSFNPTGFDADEWIRLAKQAGMGYFVITAKHHDGFAMYDSKVSD
jgi:alpha-L-fucosidase